MTRKYFSALLLMILSGCHQSHLHNYGMSCQTDSDCKNNSRCRSKPGGGSECRSDLTAGFENLSQHNVEENKVFDILTHKDVFKPSSSDSNENKASTEKNNAELEKIHKPNAEGTNTVFGMTFGEPISLPLCSDVRSRFLSTDVEKMCYSNEPTGKGYESVTIKFPLSNLPNIIKFDKDTNPIAFLSLTDGMLKSIQFFTKGVNHADLDLRALRKKYGKPFSFKSDLIQNRMGAVFKTYDATWRLKNVNVEVVFLSYWNNLDTGIISIGKDEIRSFTEALEMRLHRGGPEL